MYALMENGKVKAVSSTAMFGWKLIQIDDGVQPIKTGYDKLVDKYRALCVAAPTEAEKDKIRKEFIEARKQYRSECAQRKSKTPKVDIIWKKPEKSNTKKPDMKYWELDNVYYDRKVGDYVPYLKNVIEATDDFDKPWKWVGKTYQEISQLDYYKDLTILTKTGKMTLAEAIAYHNKYHKIAIDANTIGDDTTYVKYKGACARLKLKIDNALDTGSNKLKEDLSFSPERRIKMIEQPLPEDDTIVACYPLEDKGYNGLVTSVACGETLIPTGVDFNTGETMYQWSKDDFIINTNGDVEFGQLMYDSKYPQLPSIIAKAKTFGYTPQTFEGFYKREPGTQIIRVGEDSYQEIPKGIRGMCITGRAVVELNAIVNFMEGNADLGNDFSDSKTIHHEDGIQTQTITEYEYSKNRDKYLDWKEVECRDFQFELDYEQEDQDQ